MNPAEWLLDKLLRRPHGKQLRVERVDAEARAETVQREVVIPLNDARLHIRDQNHVYEQLKKIIEG